MRAMSGAVRPEWLGPRALGTALVAGVMCFGAELAGGQTPPPPPVVVSQTSWLAAFPSNGRVLTGANAAGTSFAVNSNGEVAIGDTSGNEVLLLNGQTGAVEKEWSYHNPGAVTMDGQGNLYVAGLYTNVIVKLPYSGGSYADLTADPYTTSPPACTGNDTQECAWGTNLQAGHAFGIAAMTFDSQGNFFFVTNGYPTGTATTPFSIFECGLSSCIATASTGSGTGAANLLFAEPAASPSTYCTSGAATMQVTPGSLAVDPWGNLFFTDSALDTCGSPDGTIDQSDYSDVNELVFSNGSYAPTPIPVYTLTPNPPLAYNDQVDAIAVDGNGTVYFGTKWGGIFAFANDGTAFTGTLTQAEIYGIWTYQNWTNGSRALALDGKGNLYSVTSLAAASGTGSLDTLGRVSVNNVPFPASPVGTQGSMTVPAAVSSAVNATDTTVAMVNDANCSTLAAGLGIAVTENGKASSEFAGAPGACVDSPFFVGESSFPITLTFTPTQVGMRSAILTAIDMASGSRQAATAFGEGQGGLVALSGSPAMTPYTGFITPTGVSVDAAGDLFVADAGANAVDKIAAGTKALSSIGSGFSSPSGTALDANGNLYVADTGNNRIVEIAGATGTTVGTQTSVVSSSAMFGGTALNGPTGLAVGADGVLYISDTGNNRVVTYNPANGLTGVRATGLNHPAGIAVDVADTLYVANVGTGSGGNVEVFPGGGGAMVTLTPNGITTPVSITVEASGSVLISDGPTGAIVRVPDEGGVLKSADATQIEQNPKSGGGLALDPEGNLYTADATGATVYAIERTALTVNFGSANDGATKNSFLLSAENAGNLPLALASGMASFLTQPSTSNFKITAGWPNDCLAATSLDSGSVCEFNAEFTPALGTASGPLSATADFESTAVNPTAVITLEGTAVFVSAATPNFTIALGTASLNVKAGGSAGTTVSVTPQDGFDSPVTFSCSGLPAGATCSFSPISVTPSGSAASTTQLTVTTSANSAKLRRNSSPLFPEGAVLACVLCFCFGFRKRRGLLTMLLLAVGVAGLGMVAGCGVHANPKPMISTVTVKGVSGSLESSASFTLNIQQ